MGVKNTANAPVLLGFEGSDPDNECTFRFKPAAVDIAPGESATSKMVVRPPKQIWIGRPLERRLEVNVKSGDEAAAIAAAAKGRKPTTTTDGKRGLGDIPGMYGPKIDKGKIFEPGVNIGPGGIQVRQPQFRAPQVRGPQMKQVNLNLRDLKMPAGQAPPAVAGAADAQPGRLPPEAVAALVDGRRRPAASSCCSACSTCSCPSPSSCPTSSASRRSSRPRETLGAEDLRLAANVEEKVDPEATPGEVLSQSPAAGEEAEKDAEVTIEVAVGDGKVEVPDLTGKTAVETDKILRDAELTRGQVNPQPADPEGKVDSQIPAAGEIVAAGTPGRRLPRRGRRRRGRRRRWRRRRRRWRRRRRRTAVAAAAAARP